jgi:DNA-binding XRE family transcriptional regulator
MSDCQFMAPKIPDNRYKRKRFSGFGAEYAAGMRKTRSDYGARLLLARQHAGLTQTQLAKAVGMGQSALGEAEMTGQGSAYTPQLAKQCGVDAGWLATGEGEMLSERTWPFVLLSPKQAASLNSANRETVEKLAIHLLNSQPGNALSDRSDNDNVSARSQVQPDARRPIPVKRVAFKTPGVEEERAQRSKPESIRTGKGRGH